MLCVLVCMIFVCLFVPKCTTLIFPGSGDEFSFLSAEKDGIFFGSNSTSNYLKFN